MHHRRACRPSRTMAWLRLPNASTCARCVAPWPLGPVVVTLLTACVRGCGPVLLHVTIQLTVHHELGLAASGRSHCQQCLMLGAGLQLDVSHCWKCTDEGLKHLPRLHHLAHLDIAYCWQVCALACLTMQPGLPGRGSAVSLCVRAHCWGVTGSCFCMSMRCMQSMLL